MKKLAIITTIVLGLAATSCDSYMDINESPNSPKESDLNSSILFHKISFDKPYPVSLCTMSNHCPKLSCR